MPSNTPEYARQWREMNRERSAEYQRQYTARKRAENPDYDRDLWYRRTYGLTLEEAETLLAKGCGICGEAGTVIDHDHETGEVRGALCRTCNLGLGHFKDDPGLLERALKYLGPLRRVA